MTAVHVQAIISRRRLDQMHALRSRTGLERVSDDDLVAILLDAGYHAEVEDLAALAESEAAGVGA